jgi:hypothetical protein
MTSKRRIRANRSNAQKSTGPRSKAGKQVSSRNAFQHGLAISTGADPAFRDGIAKLATALSDSEASRATALEAAEAAVDLSRIRKIRVLLFEKMRTAGLLDLNCLAELNVNLTKLERYERRAFSRRNRALRAIH